MLYCACRFDTSSSTYAFTVRGTPPPPYTGVGEGTDGLPAGRTPAAGEDFGSSEPYSRPGSMGSVGRPKDPTLRTSSSDALRPTPGTGRRRALECEDTALGSSRLPNYGGKDA